MLAGGMANLAHSGSHVVQGGIPWSCGGWMTQRWTRSAGTVRSEVLSEGPDEVVLLADGLRILQFDTTGQTGCVHDVGRVICRRLTTVGTAHHEIGNGIYTVSRWNAAETWGLHRGYYLRDTGATGPGLWGGSSATTSLVPVLAKGCDTLREELA